MHYRVGASCQKSKANLGGREEVLLEGDEQRVGHVVHVREGRVVDRASAAMEISTSDVLAIAEPHHSLHHLQNIFFLSKK